MKATAEHNTHAATRAQRPDSNSPFFSILQEEIGGVVFSTTPFFQSKLKVDAPNNKHEQEADAMTDKGARWMGVYNSIRTKSLSSINYGTSLLQYKCAECEQEEGLQNKENNSSSESNNLIQKRVKKDRLQRLATQKDSCSNYDKAEIEKSNIQKNHLLRGVTIYSSRTFNYEADIIEAEKSKPKKY